MIRRTWPEWLAYPVSLSADTIAPPCSPPSPAAWRIRWSVEKRYIDEMIRNRLELIGNFESGYWKESITWRQISFIGIKELSQVKPKYNQNATRKYNQKVTRVQLKCYFKCYQSSIGVRSESAINSHWLPVDSFEIEATDRQCSTDNVLSTVFGRFIRVMFAMFQCAPVMFVDD